MQSVSKFWLWIVLTVPATTLCFTFYFIWNRREENRKRKPLDDDEQVREMIDRDVEGGWERKGKGGN